MKKVNPSLLILVIKEIVILDEVGVFFQVAISLGKENHIGSAVSEIFGCYFNIGIITINFNLFYVFQYFEQICACSFINTNSGFVDTRHEQI